MLDGAKFEEKQQIVKKLLNFGLSLIEISDVTGLSVDEIEKLN